MLNFNRTVSCQNNFNSSDNNDNIIINVSQ